MTSSANVADAVLGGLADVRDWQEEFYRDLHRHPELSHQETETAGKVAERRRGFGYDVHEGIGGTGLVGVLRSGAGQLLADGTEHGAGTVVARFQPAEETSDGLAKLLPNVDVALAQHVLPAPAGHVGTRAGPVLSAADSMRITVYGRGAHGYMPQSAVDPMVLAAMIVLRLQIIVSREIAPAETAVLTVGSIQAGSKSNVITDRAVLQLNIRTYSEMTRTLMLDAIRRIVIAECEASDSPKAPEFELFDRFPLTDNDNHTTAQISEAFTKYFGDRCHEMPQGSASEDFSKIPAAFGVPYSYWGIGGIDPATYQKAADSGRVSQDIPVNHSPEFASVIQPTLDTGTQTLVVAALAWLAQK